MLPLEFAIKMEHDGEKYYISQADKNSGGLKTVFMLLASDEREHALLLATKRGGQKIDEQNESVINYDNIFEKSADFRSEIRAKPLQIEVYRQALVNEQKSISLYQEMLDACSDEDDRKTFTYLLKQEQAHARIFEDLISLVERPQEWVESAEFGIREEY